MARNPTKNSKQHPQKPRPRKTCVFCGNEGRLTEEHIFGDWLRKAGYSGEGFKQSGNPPIIRKGGAFSSKLKIVCGTCNNGWMSELENQAKPLLIDMFNADDKSVELDEAAQLILASWAFKTVVISAFDGKLRGDAFPKEHRDEFYNEVRPPLHSQIYIGAASVPRIVTKGDYVAGYLYKPACATTTFGGNEVSFPFYRSSFRLLNVVFDVLGYISEDVTLEGEPAAKLQPAVLPIWPPTHPRIWWPPVTNLDQFGGLDGLAAGTVDGIATFVPTEPAGNPGGPAGKPT